MPAATARPRNGPSANALDPDASATRPAHSEKPKAAAGAIASPGCVAKRAPASQEATARTVIAPVITVRWAASFSIAIRRRPKGAAATRSRLPRLASAARVPESATIGHRLATETKTGPHFHIT